MKAATLILSCAIFLAISIGYSESRPRWFELKGYSFDQYVSDFGKQYASASEYNARKKLFETRLQEIHSHNSDSTKTWKQGVNHLSDRTEEEFRRLLGYRKDIAYSMAAEREAKAQKNMQLLDIDALPKSVDWRQKGIISAVKDQGDCGSCWSFGTAESVESYWALATGQLSDLSEQNILDCTPNPNDCGGTGGCGGGTPELAYAQIIKTGGLASEWTYPYISYFGSNFNCRNSTTPFARLASYNVLPSNTYVPVMNALATTGPLAVNVDASSWSSYETGVFDGCNQQNPDIDHVVQLVGYGTDPSQGDYYLVRNSWNPGWGEDGYIRLKRTSNEQTRCGTDVKPSDGTGCNGGPSQVTVCGTCAILYDVSYPIVQTNKD
jgi:cathepsin L